MDAERDFYSQRVREKICDLAEDRGDAYKIYLFKISQNGVNHDYIAEDYLDC